MRINFVIVIMFLMVFLGYPSHSSDRIGISVRVSESDHGLLWTAILLFESNEEVHRKSLLLAIVEPERAKELSLETERDRVYLVDGWEKSFEIKKGALIYGADGDWFLLPQQPPYAIFDHDIILRTLDQAMLSNEKRIGWELLSD